MVWASGGPSCDPECKDCEKCEPGSHGGDPHCEGSCSDPAKHCTEAGCVECSPPRPSDCAECEDGSWEGCGSGAECIDGECCDNPCNGTCCDENQECIDGSCCDEANVCGGDKCCGEDEECIDGDCCASENVCGGDKCCEGSTEICRGGDHCCKLENLCGGSGEDDCCEGSAECIDFKCCPGEDVCGDDKCCEEGSEKPFCVDEKCVECNNEEHCEKPACLFGVPFGGTSGKFCQSDNSCCEWCCDIDLDGVSHGAFSSACARGIFCTINYTCNFIEDFDSCAGGENSCGSKSHTFNYSSFEGPPTDNVLKNSCWSWGKSPEECCQNP